MNCIIDRILIFGNANEVREVKLKRGLNIISGDSKTGKSALIEIVDYCLYSSRSSIPQGVITDFAKIFVLVLLYDDKYVVLGRFGSNSSTPGKCIFNVFLDESDIDKLSFKNIDTWKKEYVKDAQLLFEQSIGFSFAGIVAPEALERGARNHKATIRGIASFIFQHQNLIANKHAMFYRFDDAKRRETTIDEWPLLMGWFDYDYFEMKATLETIDQNLRVERRNQQQYLSNVDKINLDLRSRVETYYNIFNKTLPPDISISNLQQLSKNLPRFVLTGMEETKDGEQLFDLQNERGLLLEERRSVDQQINLIKKNTEIATQHYSSLEAIQSRTFDLDPGETSALDCPLCHSNLPEASQAVVSARHAGSLLTRELSKLSLIARDPSGEREGLKAARAEIESKLRIIQQKIDTIKSFQASIASRLDQISASEHLRGEIEATSRYTMGMTSVDKAELLKELEYQSNLLRTKLSGYDENAKHQDAKLFLEQKMALVRKDLDFEDDLKDAKMSFDTMNFDFHLFKSNNKIHLSEMGSGANWLACHLSLFLSLLWLHAKNGARVPSFLFLDQPSQVYFPRGLESDVKLRIDETEETTLSDERNEAKKDEETTKSDSNITAVTNIYLKIINTLASIDKDCGFLPQVIVTDHIGHLNIDPWKFEDFVRYRWTDETGIKLI